MLKNLGNIFTYLNETLLGGELENISEVIEYLEQAQNKICERDPLETPVYVLALSTNELTVPNNFQKFVKLTVDDIQVSPTDYWNKVLYLPTENVSGTAKLWYYRKPTSLDPTNNAQVPDIDPRYFSVMADYAAKRYYLADDDDDMKKAFDDEFWSGITFLTHSSGIVQNFTNIW